MRLPTALCVLALGSTLSATAAGQSEFQEDDDVGDEQPVDDPAGTPAAFASGDSEVDDTEGDSFEARGGGASDKKFQLGLRTGFGIPLGKAAANGAELSDGLIGKIPIGLDLMYKVTQNVHVGLYGIIGIGLLKSTDLSDPSNFSSLGCPDVDGVSCSALIFRFGAQAAYHLSPEKSVDPWFGAGIGYEIARAAVSAGQAESSAAFRGIEFLQAQLGLDFNAPSGFPLGLFASFSFGQYSNFSVKTESDVLSQDLSGEIDDKAIHNWVLLGVRGGVDL